MLIVWFWGSSNFSSVLVEVLIGIALWIVVLLLIKCRLAIVDELLHLSY